MALAAPDIVGTWMRVCASCAHVCVYARVCVNADNRSMGAEGGRVEFAEEGLG